MELVAKKFKAELAKAAYKDYKELCKAAEVTPMRYNDFVDTIYSEMNAVDIIDKEILESHLENIEELFNL